MKGIGMKNFSGYTVVAAILATATLAGCPPRVETHTEVLADVGALDATSLYFIPAVSDDLKREGDAFYTRIVEDAPASVAVAGEPLDFTGGPVTVALDTPVYYYGELRESLVINVDGTIGFDAVGGGNDTLEQHFIAPQISVMPIIATTAGTEVTVSQDADKIVVDYANVVIGDTSKAVTTDNNFQVIFYIDRGIDGDFEIVYSNVNPFESPAIVGLSNGQLAADENFLRGFQESNLLVNANTDRVN